MIDSAASGSSETVIPTGMKEDPQVGSEATFLDDKMDKATSENFKKEAENPSAETTESDSNPNEDEPIEAGERPEWLKDKYKDVEDQAKAYTELEKKLGAFKGAPEEYEVEVPENLQELMDINIESESFLKFEEFAREANMSQEAFEKCTEMHLHALNDLVNADISKEDFKEYERIEIEKLGEGGPQMVEQLKQWGKNNLSADEFDVFKGLGDSASSIQLLKSIINKTTNTNVPADISHKPSHSRHDLREAMVSPRYHNDRDYQKEIDQAYVDMFTG